MARMKITGFPPVRDAGDLWCAVCAALCKGALLLPQYEAIEAGLADASREEFQIGVDPQKAYAMLNLAVTVAPAIAMQGAVVPLCWLHLPTIDGDAPPPEPQQQQEQKPRLVVPGQPGRM